VAVHPRLTKYPGEKSILNEHIPEAAQAYKNTTVQYVIQQALFIEPIFKEFIERFLLENPSGNLRRAQGFVREARAVKGKVSTDIFRKILVNALSDLQRFNQVRVENFKKYMQQYLKENLEVPSVDQIKRGQNNPMLRKNQTLH
jgi:hypothetical protein